MKKIFKTVYLLSIIILVLSCDNNDELDTVVQKEFGLIGSHDVATFTAPNFNLATVYYPVDIATMSNKTPLVLFTSGWGSEPFLATKYDALLRFVASHGYTVVYTDEGRTTNSEIAINRIEDILACQDSGFKDAILPFINFKKLGVIGHSAGGGTTLTTLKHFSNFGNEGRFVMAFDPWYSFDMSANDIKTLPSNTNLVLLKFGHGGNSANDGTDARIPLTIYSLLESIPNNHKDYQVYDRENADHHYPYNDLANLQGIVKPLDALLDYTFIEQSERTRIVALENGSDDPYASGQGIQVVLDTYQYPCDGVNTIINYCEIID